MLWKWQVRISKSSCVMFTNKYSIKTFQERHWLINLSESSSEENTGTLKFDSPPKHATRLVVENVRTLEKKCFICNEIRTVGNEAYKDGGVARITCEGTTDKIQKQEIFLY